MSHMIFERIKENDYVETKKKTGLIVIFRLLWVLNIQLFRERLSEKVHATIPKGIVGSFEFTLL